MSEEFFVVEFWGITRRHRRFENVDEALKFVNKLPTGDFINAVTVTQDKLDIPKRRGSRSAA